MGKLSNPGREKKAGVRGRRTTRPPRPQGDFTPRASRRRAIVGAVPEWRILWYATRGWGSLLDRFAEGLKARVAAQ